MIDDAAIHRAIEGIPIFKVAFEESPRPPSLPLIRHLEAKEWTQCHTEEVDVLWKVCEDMNISVNQLNVTLVYQWCHVRE